MRWWKACVPWHPMNLRGFASTQQKGLLSSKEQLSLAAPCMTLGPWLGPPWVPAVECQLGNIPGHAAAEPSPSSPQVRSGLEGGLGAHYCQLQWSAGHGLAVRLWENVTSCFIIFCPGPLPELAFGPRQGAGTEQWSRGIFAGKGDWFMSLGSLQVAEWQAGPAAHLAAPPSPAGTPCPPSTFPCCLGNGVDLKCWERDSEPNGSSPLPPLARASPLPTITIKSMSHFRKPNWRSPAENKGDVPSPWHIKFFNCT